MLNEIAYMTKEEKRATLKHYNDLDAATKIDTDVVFEAMEDSDIFINDFIHINMLKCEVLIHMKKPIYPFTKEDYIAICSLPTEEERRNKLSEVLAQKEKEYNMTDKNLGKVLNKKDDPNEPVLPCVAETDAKVGEVAADRLRSLVERIERLEEEKKGILSDIRDIFAEAKSAGFDVKAMRAILKLRAMNAADRDEQTALVAAYKKALDL